MIFFIGDLYILGIRTYVHVTSNTPLNPITVILLISDLDCFTIRLRKISKNSILMNHLLEVQEQ